MISSGRRNLLLISNAATIDPYKNRYHIINNRPLNNLRNIMISVDMILTQEMQHIIAENVRQKQLAFNLSQRTLSEKSGAAMVAAAVLILILKKNSE